MPLTGLLLFCFLSGIAADCFVEQDSPGKRDLLHLSDAVDDFHCKIQCYLNKTCLAYKFDAKLKGCAQLGLVSGFTCTLPILEQKTKSCPTIPAPASANVSYTQNPSIDDSLILPIYSNTYVAPYNGIPCGPGWNAIDLVLPDGSHRVVASYYAVNIVWDAELGAWTYKDFQADRILIRASACFSIPLADAHALAEDECAPLKNVRASGYGPPAAPYNRSWPCEDRRASQVWYLSAGANENNMPKNEALINCVYGVWLYLQELKGVKQTREIVSATCV